MKNNNNGNGFKKFLGITAVAATAAFIAGVVIEFKKLKQAEKDAEAATEEDIPEDTAVEEAPAEETPVAEAPAEEAPATEAPAEEAPAAAEKAE